MAPNRDIELNTLKYKEDSLGMGSSYSMRDFSMREPSYDPTPRRGAWGRFFESFERDPDRRMIPKYAASSRRHTDEVTDYDSINDGGAHHYDLQHATLVTSNPSLARKLKGRHLQMIAIGGSIGTGLFVASGKALANGGPASLLLAFSLVGGMLYCTCQALGELAVSFPVAGSFSAYSTRFIDPSWGFAMGWNYAFQWLIVLPLEIIAASITLGYWQKNMTNAIFVTIFLLFIIGINMFGVKGYGEAEFIFSLIKVVAVIAFILLGIVLNIGGVPGKGYIGGTYWHDPGAFQNGFKGLCSVFVTAAFAFAGTELVGLAAAETANPRKSLPTAIKQVFWRITLFYIVALTLVGLLVPSNDPNLATNKNTSQIDVNLSPFVIAIRNAKIDILPDVMNAVILIAVLSVGNSAVFGSSRTLAALADQRQAPYFLSYIDRKGRPLMAIGVASVIGLLSYIADHQAQDQILDWLLAASGLSSIFTWGSICLCHIRFRAAWRANGRHPSELAWQSQVGVAGSWCGLIMNLLVLVAQFWVGAFPIGYVNKSPGEITREFFLRYLAFPIVASFYIGHKLYYRTKLIHIKDMDVDTGRRDFNLHILKAQEEEERKYWPRWKKVYKFLC
ncbi:general amino-acid permease GAP1 [Plectosphaerella cucumerina]|uniref:General amino-acid permease GAP1 n=1 Tax=Plectosphaerella cucumerina TaxID=40658 RepID=A0A8K0TC39_9PEZI|nr:general amino-acid permease GAP1 [Plectosphaerella cucumerina]